MAKKAPVIVKAHCPKCDGERNCVQHGTTYKAWDWEDHYGNSMNGGVDHSLLECQGCETVFYETSSWDSESVDPYYNAMGETEYNLCHTKVTYPKPDTKTKPAWVEAMTKIDAQLHGILSEMYLAYDNHAYILTAIGLRTALDRGTEVLGIDAAKRFDEKLDALRDGGWIGETERDILGIVTDAGNAAAHRGWGPDEQEVRQLLYAMEVFLQRAFIHAKGVLLIKGNIPQRPKRLPPPAAAGTTT